MSCFWTHFVGTYDPLCVSTTVVSASPIRMSSAEDLDPVNFQLFSDAALTEPLFPTVARITEVKVYDTSGDVSGCTYDAWWIAGPPFVNPPGVGGDPLAHFAQSIDFDPTGPVPIGAITGIADIPGGVAYLGNIQFTVVLTIVTDTGTCYLVASADYCF